MSDAVRPPAAAAMPAVTLLYPADPHRPEPGFVPLSLLHNAGFAVVDLETALAPAPPVAAAPGIVDIGAVPSPLVDTPEALSLALAVAVAALEPQTETLGLVKKALIDVGAALDAYRRETAPARAEAGRAAKQAQ